MQENIAFAHERLGITTDYLNSDAIANYMQMADQSSYTLGGADGRLSAYEFSEFLHETIYMWYANDNSHPGWREGMQLHIGNSINRTRDTIMQLLPMSDESNILHYDVNYVIGKIFTVMERLNLASYDDLINKFNDSYNPPPPPPTQQPPCGDFINTTGTTGNYGRPRPPRSYDHCRNCDGDEPISTEQLRTYPLNELRILPSGNCITNDNLQELRAYAADQGERARDPINMNDYIGEDYEGEDYEGGRKSRKARKAKKSRKAKTSINK